jgi:hypothetical protein
VPNMHVQLWECRKSGFACTDKGASAMRNGSCSEHEARCCKEAKAVGDISLN